MSRTDAAGETARPPDGDDAPLQWTTDLPDEAATGTLATRLSRVLAVPDVVGLRGPLGSGKTTFARALIRALGRPDEEVPSPTFTLVQSYDLPRFALWHFDLYRLERWEDAYELAVEDAFAEGVSLIEWPERLGPLLPSRSLMIAFDFVAGASGRRVRLSGGPEWRNRLSATLG